MYIILSLLALLAPVLVSAQVAAGGGLGATPVVAATQFPTVGEFPSLSTNGDKTTAIYGPYTQTFVSTALGSLVSHSILYLLPSLCLFVLIAWR
jgi:hypothetical protein